MVRPYRGRRHPAVAPGRARPHPRGTRTLWLYVGWRSAAPVGADRVLRRRPRPAARDGYAYECACTRRELESAPIGAGGERVYPGTCRNGIPPDRIDRPQRAWRVRVGAARIEVRDRLQGRQTQDLARDVGDFVVKRTDGLHAYQLAVVVDDALQGITDVVRGADLLASTARQVHLQHLLGYPPVTYLHLPIAVDAAGEKLSKQTGAAALPDRTASRPDRRLALPRATAPRRTPHSRLGGGILVMGGFRLEPRAAAADRDAPRSGALQERVIRKGIISGSAEELRYRLALPPKSWNP